MGRNITETTGKEIVTKQVPVGVELKDQRNPSLSGDMDARGHDLKNVGDVQAKTVNGRTIEQEVERFFDGVKREFGEFAPVKHSHPELAELSEAIDGKADKDHAHKLEDHTHSFSSITGTVTLDRVEHGEEISVLLSKEICPLKHSHPNLEAAIKTLDDNIKIVAKAVDAKVSPEAITGLTQSLNALEDALRHELKALEKKIPVLPKQERNIIGIKRVHVPSSGLVQEIVGRDENGSPTKVTVTRSGKEIKVGDALAADDILALSPASASVRVQIV
jgi:hypothetical protein